ncbi:hypothetical protein CSUI_002938, partial [Cystoisospora suis]
LLQIKAEGQETVESPLRASTRRITPIPISIVSIEPLKQQQYGLLLRQEEEGQETLVSLITKSCLLTKSRDGGSFSRWPFSISSIMRQELSVMKKSI